MLSTNKTGRTHITSALSKSIMATVASAAIAGSILAGGVALASGASASENADGTSASSAAESAQADTASLASAASDSNVADVTGKAGDVTVTGEDVSEYCGMCHLTTVENDTIASFNSSNVDRAMVESMVPMLDDDTIDALADYFSQIEPPAQNGDQQA